MSDVIRLTTPLSDEDVVKLKAGDRVLISGVIYTGRDAAHKRMIEALEKGEPLPFDVKGQVIYYVGPSPAKPGRPIGAAGPTTSYRMNPYAPKLIRLGLKGMIGKGKMSEEVREHCIKYKAVYFGAIGGCGALLSQRIKKAEVIAYEDLGPEAVRRLEVEDFPVIVVYDTHGGNLEEIGIKQYRVVE
ncbi:MAG: Fe-S-containing hydro-lyase [Deferribacteres bacterium]|nr:Fe-S-containing hydro-lyase [Deferribacteres bacterium]